MYVRMYFVRSVCVCVIFICNRIAAMRRFSFCFGFNYRFSFPFDFPHSPALKLNKNNNVTATTTTANDLRSCWLVIFFSHARTHTHTHTHMHTPAKLKNCFCCYFKELLADHLPIYCTDCELYYSTIFCIMPISASLMAH